MTKNHREDRFFETWDALIVHFELNKADPTSRFGGNGHLAD